MFTSADRNLAETIFARVADATAAPGGGVCRPSYGHNETAAWSVVADAARGHDLHVRADAAGNLVILRDDRDREIPPGATWVGSHLDSVPCGGNYDGLAGVVAALLMLIKAREKSLSLPIVGLGLRGEESAWFGVPYLGSKAILGRITERDLDRHAYGVAARRAAGDGHVLYGNADEHVTLRECMQEVGIDPQRLVVTPPLVQPQQIAEFWELHIEQGPVLAASGKPVGVVSGIRGSVRALDARVTGSAGHSGTTPHHMREDAVVRFVEVMTKLDDRRREIVAAGGDLVFTCGIVGTNPARHSVTTIADEVRFSLDVRSLVDDQAWLFMRYAESIGVKFGPVDQDPLPGVIPSTLGNLVQTPSAACDPKMRERLFGACERLGVEHRLMPSGAGHDAAVFQQAGVPTGMIFVRNENGSHNPDEAMSMDDFMIGCEVLWRAITSGTR
jgi:beta-ureidopropionase / N-carbamoyl-L-amino-acid hydrolase